MRKVTHFEVTPKTDGMRPFQTVVLDDGRVYERVHMPEERQNNQGWGDWLEIEPVPGSQAYIDNLKVKVNEADNKPKEYVSCSMDMIYLQIGDIFESNYTRDEFEVLYMHKHPTNAKETFVVYKPVLNPFGVLTRPLGDFLSAEGGVCNTTFRIIQRKGA